MAEDRDDAAALQGPAKLMKRAREIASARSASASNAPHRVMPRDVLQGKVPPPVPRDPDNAPDPRPRGDQARLGGDGAPDVTEVRLPPNPVTGKPAGGGLDMAPLGEATVDALSDDDAQLHLDQDLTVVRVPKPPPADEPSKPAPEAKPAEPKAPPSKGAEAGNPRLATAEDLGMSGADLQQEPLLKWIAIGLGLMFFVSAAFAVVAVIVVAMTT